MIRCAKARFNAAKGDETCCAAGKIFHHGRCGPEMAAKERINRPPNDEEQQSNRQIRLPTNLHWKGGKKSLLRKELPTKWTLSMITTEDKDHCR